MSRLRALLRAVRRGDRGSSTLEYVLLMSVTAALGGVLLRIVMSDATYKAMSKMVGEALT